MTLVNLKNRQSLPVFNNLMDDLFPEFSSILNNGAKQRSFSAPVNIRETQDAYQLELMAPGFEKENFQVHLDEGLLTISAEHKTEEKQENEKWIRNEFSLKSFKRSFTVDENIDAEKIAAKYINGVLTLNLPKKMEVKEPAKQITIE